MKLVYKYGPCLCIKLFKLGRYNVELVRCPTNYTIPQHYHGDQDIELMFLKGDATFFRKAKICDFKHTPELDSYDYKCELQFRDVKGFHFRNLFKTFSIPAGTLHWFSVSTQPLWFINFSKWKPGVKVTSAAVDFKETNV